ncbi:hypothetical protein VTL71DRAFT_5222 [Oculimacula yallundae]|uniref:Uncharacterized protein n=1 Tax=Oculimacula yallundae TaxID=86028 RepID=A0ABR4C145_9HELO
MLISRSKLTPSHDLYNLYVHDLHICTPLAIPTHLFCSFSDFLSAEPLIVFCVLLNQFGWSIGLVGWKSGADRGKFGLNPASVDKLGTVDERTVPSGEGKARIYIIWRVYGRISQRRRISY